MQYVNFGTTGLQISRLGFGGIPIQRIDQPGTRELLIAAHKAGINYIGGAARGKGQGHRRAYRHHGAPGRCV